MTRIEILDFPSKFAVFRNHHADLIFQIIKATNNYNGANCYILENDLHGTSQMYQRYQTVSMKKLPFENSDSIYVTTQGTRSRRRILWNSKGLFLSIPSLDGFSQDTVIPILGLSDYTCLPAVHPYCTCFVEEFYPRSIHRILHDRDDFSEIHKWLRIEQILLTWFSYQNAEESDVDNPFPRRNRHRRSTRVSLHMTGPDDHDDRLTIPQDELVGVLRHRNPYEAGEYETEIIPMEPSRPRPRNNQHRAREAAIGAGASASSQEDTGSTTVASRPRLQKFTVDAIIEYAVNTEMSCPIKMELITRQNAGVLSCQHVFIKDEIERWLTTNTCCPLCRETAILC